MRIIGVLFVILAAGMAYIRFAPINFARFASESMPTEEGDYPEAGGMTVVRPLKGDATDVLAKVRKLMLDMPSTVVVAEAPLMFVTRSRMFGFPDVTTVVARDGILVVRGHLVYGLSDLGANKARIMRILNALN